MAGIVFTEGLGNVFTVDASAAAAKITIDGSNIIETTNGAIHYTDVWPTCTSSIYGSDSDAIDIDPACRTVKVDNTSTGSFSITGASSKFIVHTPISPTKNLREIIRSRTVPAFINDRRRHYISSTSDLREVRARLTLRRVLGDKKYRGFINNGFITVRGKSGKTYQIFPGYDITRVYENGKLIDKLCIILKGNFPPTDSLIMRYLLILNDEDDFRSQAISHSVSVGFVTSRPKRDVRSLPEIFAQLKKRAA